VSTLRPIGAVVAELGEEFPDLTASKVRYLEAEGLIEPMRTSRGSRRYADVDVERLRRILRLQRDEFLPLSVIGERLDQPDGITEGAQGAVAAVRLRAPRARRMTAAEVAQRGGVDASTLKDLVTHGLVTEMDSGAVDVCRLVVRLRDYGIEPRHLRSFRVAADREVGLVQQALAPRRGSSSALEQRELTAGLLALLLDLHIALVRQRSSTLEA
jgi:DNA-binding transcriptional MerR regulator